MKLVSSSLEHSSGKAFRRAAHDVAQTHDIGVDRDDCKI